MVKQEQTTVATSSVDGEYQAGSMTVRHGCGLRRLLIELGLDELETSPTTIFIDNRGAIDLTKDNRHTSELNILTLFTTLFANVFEEKTFMSFIALVAEMLQMDSQAAPTRALWQNG